MNDEMTESKDWWKHAIIYQIYPRSFMDSNGDGVGDLPGITEKLDHVAGLGVDGIWISPFFKSPMDDYGYDVSDYVDVDPLFGTLADFDALIEKAHGLGLKVIIDQVLSHSSNQHDWFKESASSRDNSKADWYVWADPKPDGSPPNNWLSNFGGVAWEWSRKRRQYYLHNFLTSQPDLNFHSEEMKEALLDTCRFWLDRGVDGFRLDVCNFIVHDPELRDNPPKDPADPRWKAGQPHSYQVHQHDISQPGALEFHRRLRSLTDEYGATMMVGEIGDDDPLQLMADYTSEPGPLHTCYSGALLYNYIRAEHIGPVIEEFYRRAPDGWPSWTFSNHDAMRSVTKFAGQRGGDEPPQGLASALNALLFALPGTIFFYQGEELGLPQAKVEGDVRRDPMGRDGARTPMVWDKPAINGGFSDGQPWLPVPHDHIARAVSEQQGIEGSVLEQTRALLAVRQKSTALRQGDWQFLDAAEDCVFLRRQNSHETVFVAVNLGPETRAMTNPSAIGEILIGDGVTVADDTITLDPYSFAYIAG